MQFWYRLPTPNSYLFPSVCVAAYATKGKAGKSGCSRRREYEPEVKTKDVVTASMIGCTSRRREPSLYKLMFAQFVLIIIFPLN